MYDDIGVAGSGALIAAGGYALNMTQVVLLGAVVILGGLLLVRLWARRHP